MVDLVTFLSRLNRAWLILGTYQSNISVGFMEYQNEMTYLLISSSASIKEIILAPFFLLGYLHVVVLPSLLCGKF